ncbi:MAG: M18 family aminopeptidase [Clostridiales bacterium]|nr:M18 family aminopeptidase [Clostridiales bacterium]
MKNNIKKLTDFINASPSNFHAVANFKAELDKNGFVDATTSKELMPNGKYYFIKNQSSLIAFAMPKTTPVGYLIAASHSDSPTFQINNNGEIVVDEKYVKLSVTPYGGMLYSTWFDRPLSIAGKILVSENEKIKTIVVNIDRDLVMIPNLAIHMNRNANSGYEYKANKDMQPLFCNGSIKRTLLEIGADNAKVNKEDILSCELYLYNRMFPSIWGANEEFLSAPRIDDLQCAFASFQAFIKAKANTHVPVFMLCDNEEVGSDTKQGAGSEFLADVLQRINSAYGNSHTDYTIELENSLMLSCDNGHAAHPNYMEFTNSCNKPYLNGGVVIKYGIRYATDSVSEALFRKICEKNNIPVQTYANREDLPGGSTLGNISNTKVGINTIDIGAAQLAMHSSYETVGASDTDHLINAVSSFYAINLLHNGNGEYCLE